MKSLAILSKFMGCYDNWKNIKERYQLKWSNGNNSPRSISKQLLIMKLIMIQC